jgi:hypothetical protein
MAITNIDIKSAKRARISRIVIYQLTVTYGVWQTKGPFGLKPPVAQPIIWRWLRTRVDVWMEAKILSPF